MKFEGGSMNILDFFPYDAPRPSQLKVLEWVQKHYDDYDVFVLQCPVAAGKSGLAVTIAKWANSVYESTCSITTPDNVLVQQYKNDFKLLTLPYANSFAGRDLFARAKADFKAAPLKLMNNFTLLANKVYSDVQIMDEAHQLIPMLQDFEGVTIWHHLECYPKTIKTVADVLLWAASLGPKDKLGKRLEKLLSKNPKDYVIVQDRDLYRGRIRDYLRIYPLTPKNNSPILWPPSRVKKLFLMSATISKFDVEDLGLHNRRVGYIEVPSDIPKENRPFRVMDIGSMGRGAQRETLPAMLGEIRRLHNANKGRGMLHTTYGLAASISASGEYPSLIFHRVDNKRELLNDWLYDNDDKRSFIGCGLTTGIDLKYDRCRWQAILKCQFPNLGDPAVAAKAERSPEWYQWTTIKQVVQAYGRVCRAPDDKGITYMLDSDFSRLLEHSRHLMPLWFLESIEEKT